MAHKKAAGSAKNLRDSNPKYRGVKIFGGQKASQGAIIIRQKGDKYRIGKNTYKGRDFTIHASVDGYVMFRKKRMTRYDGRVYLRTIVDVVPQNDVAEKKESTPKAKATVKSKKSEPKTKTTKKTASTKKTTKTTKSSPKAKKTTTKKKPTETKKEAKTAKKTK